MRVNRSVLRDSEKRTAWLEAAKKHAALLSGASVDRAAPIQIQVLMVDGRIRPDRVVPAPISLEPVLAARKRLMAADALRNRDAVQRVRRRMRREELGRR